LWRYDFYSQSQDRIHRIGQNRPVMYMRLTAADTIEEAIVQALSKKSELARALLGDADGTAAVSGLSPAEFCNIVVRNQLPGSVPTSR
jgi:SNF2 family DNA or RNA helicase